MMTRIVLELEIHGPDSVNDATRVVSHAGRATTDRGDCDRMADEEFLELLRKKVILRKFSTEVID